MSNTTDQYFHFTLGPVQGFVAQARRTRDFWAGSFLLSWLAGVAIKAVEKQNGTILFPEADESFLKFISGIGQGARPLQGSIPNRFKAKVPLNFDAKLVVDSVKLAWKALAETIYQADNLSAYELPKTRAIWDRQVNNFWDMSWALVDDKTISNVLDRRKNWRTLFTPDEAGVKCTLMRDWQELSGIEEVRKADAKERNDFWANIARGKETDFKSNEYLCSMAFIKRRFVHHFASFKADLPTGISVHGWEVPKSVPSVSYLAAVPWFSKVLNKVNKGMCKPDALSKFVDAASNLVSLNEYSSKIRSLQEQINEPHVSKRVISVDGNVFHESTLENINIFPDVSSSSKVKSALKNLAKEAKVGPVSPFYAVLMMDGDSLGKHMGDQTKQVVITKALDAFTKQVPDLVSQNNGYLIYAGGDDVLALVTLDDALKCALAIREVYVSAFKEQTDQVKIEDKEFIPTISAAISYVHIRTPLSNVLHDSHELLDDVAKSYAGRDAIAVRVLKPGGVALTWAKKWELAINKRRDDMHINDLVNDFISEDKDDEQFSNKFFYRIRERFSMLDETESTLNKDLKIDLLTVDYCRSKDNKVDFAEARQKVSKLLEQCTSPKKEHQIDIDGALFVRFLAQKGIEGGRV